MRSIAFRRILPIVQLALFIALMTAYKARPWPQGSTTEIREDDISAAINLPASSFSTRLIPMLYSAGVLHKRGHADVSYPDPRAEKVFFIAYGLGVVFLWFLVGLWLDRRLGGRSLPLPLLPQSPRTFWQVLTWLGLGSCAGYSAYAFYDAYQTKWPDHHFGMFAVGVWYAYGVLVLALMLRRWRALAREGSRTSQP